MSASPSLKATLHTYASFGGGRCSGLADPTLAFPFPPLLFIFWPFPSFLFFSLVAARRLCEEVLPLLGLVRCLRVLGLGVLVGGGVFDPSCPTEEERKGN